MPNVSPDSLGDMLRRIGINRYSMVRFMKSIRKDDRSLAVDFKHVLSMSEGIISATLGHNSMDEHLPQVQDLFLVSLGHDSPTYFRILAGSINSIASLTTSIGESGVKRIVLVADTRFYSSSNIRDLDSNGMSYIIPMRRNSMFIDYPQPGEKHFMFQDLPLFYSKYSHEKSRVYTLRKSFLKAEEEKEFLRRNEKITESTIAKLRERMGII